MIDVKHLIYEYPTTRALDDVSVHVPKGAIAALVGPNGAGKTTLLRCIAALERPFSGTVEIAGLDTQDYPREIHEQVGYLPDSYGLYMELSVAQCLSFAARAHGLSAREASQAVEQAAVRVALSDRMDAKAQELSGGMRQRLAIGQAIVHEPPLLLLDEPASNLDPEARRALATLFRQFQAEGVTLVVSSHILAELKAYSSHMIIMDQGRVVESLTVSARPVVRVELAEANASLGSFLGGQAGVTLIEASDRVATAELDGTGDPAQQRAALLKALVAGGFAVSSVTDFVEDLEDTYFSRVQWPQGSGGGA